MNYEKDIIDYLVENHICTNREDASDFACMNLNMHDALDAYLNWNGIIGYTNTIIEIVKDYTTRQMTHIVIANNKTYVFRNHKAYKACVARLEKAYTKKGVLFEKQNRLEEGMGWIDNYTIFKTLKK